MRRIPQQITWTFIGMLLTHWLPFSYATASRALACPTPTGVTLLSTSSVSANFSWQPSGPAGTLYQWEIGLPNFTPGTNTFIYRDSTTDTLGFALGLVSSTALKLQIRAICGTAPGDTSDWSDPVLFTTAPGCNDVFTDPGGLLGNYPNSTMDTALICPSSDSEVVQLTFLTFATELNGDHLKIYDGTNAAAPQLANLSGLFLPPFEPLPGPYTATNASGCLYTLFFSNSQFNDEGWSALVSCVPPDTCLAPIDLQLDSLGASTAQVSWMPLFGAQQFEWELGIVPYDPGGTPVQNDTTSSDTLLLSNLASSTHYILYVRSKCDSLSASDWVSVTFSTPVSCGDTLYDSGGPAADYSDAENYTTIICPDSANHTVTLTFIDFKTQQNQDILHVHDGGDTLAPEVAAFSGNTIPPPVTATNASGCLTLHFISDGSNHQNGWEATVGCDTATTCFGLLDLNLDFVQSDSVSVSWTPIFGAMGYVWALDTMAFVPGVDTAFLSDTVMTNALQLDSLLSGHSYVLYVKTKCASDTSAWFGPLHFSTPPGCGDNFYDTGGATLEYSNNEDYTTVICPDTLGEVVTLSFTDFKSKNGDTLTLYNGGNANPLLILGKLTGNPVPPTYTATIADGCITARFHSNADGTDLGWAAGVSCAPPATCNDVLFFHLDSVVGTTVDVSWYGVAGAVQYEWKLGLISYTPGSGAAADSGFTTSNALTLSGLAPLTNYTLWVRTLCANDTAAFSQHVLFATSVDCFTGNKIFCGDTASTTVNGIGDWLLKCDPDTSQHQTSGKETVFAFTAPVTKSYQLLVDTVIGGGYMDFYFKEAADGCSPVNWSCIGDFSQKDSAVFGPLTAGNTYLILLDPETTNSLTAKFHLGDCSPVNDNAFGAIPLTVDEPCLSNIHANANASLFTGEPDPDSETDASDTLAGRWKTMADQTVWFRFEAPASGTVTVEASGAPFGGSEDTQIALYAAADPADYTTFQYIDSDEDNGTTADSLNAALYYTGLTPGAPYFVQVDINGTATSTFCIEVLDGIYRFNNGQCADAHAVTGVNGTVSGGDRWYGIYAGQDSMDQGQLVAAVKPGAQILDTVSCQIMVYNDSIPLSDNGVPYMPAYFNFRSTTAPSLPVQIRLFFYNYELNALKIKTGLLSNTAEDLNVSQYIGPNPSCSPAGHSTADVILLDTVQAVNTGGTASFYLEFTTTKPQLGEFGAHFGAVVLPIELLSFTGTVRDNDNMLEWTTAAEKNVLWHIVERSADAMHWTEVGRLPGQALSTQQLHYHLADVRPVPQAYYRLRTLDSDGKMQVSGALFLVRDKERLAIAGAYPSPTADRLNLQLVSSAAEEVQWRIFDLNGRQVMEHKEMVDKGLTTLSLFLSNLQPGVYTLSVSDGFGVTAPIRVVKQ